MNRTPDEILQWVREQGRPVLFSEVTDKFGPWAPTHAAFNALIDGGHVSAVFPEAKRGDSGRQFWEASTLNGEGLKALRRTAGVKAKVLAAKLEISPEHLSRIERGHKPLTRVVELAARFVLLPRDRDAAPRKAEGFEAEGQQPGPEGGSPKYSRQSEAIMTNTDELIELVAKAIESAEFSYRIDLTRLVDGEATYTLHIDGEDDRWFPSNDEAREYVAERRAQSRAKASLEAIDQAGLVIVPREPTEAARNEALEEAAKVADRFYFDVSQSQLDDRDNRLMQDTAHQASEMIAESIRSLIQAAESSRS